MLKRFFLLGLTLVSVGCATFVNPATGLQDSILITTPAEISLGRRAASGILRQVARGPRVDPELIQRVQTIGQRVAAVSERQDLNYRFHVVPDRALNAFTVLGGDVYVHSGLVQETSDDELAAVLAHEIGHVAARHGVKGVQAQLGYSLVMQAAFGGKSNQTAQVVNTAFTLVNRGFSRQDELEADLLGVRYSARSGYDPRGAIRFFNRLRKKYGDSPTRKTTIYWSTHPLYEDRIAHAERQIEKLKASGEWIP